MKSIILNTFFLAWHPQFLIYIYYIESYTYNINI